MMETNYYHSLGTPCLVSSVVLRSRELGQVDVAYLQKKDTSWQLQIIEVKSKIHPSPKQMKRLLKAQDFLARILEMETHLKVNFCKNDQDSLFF